MGVPPVLLPHFQPHGLRRIYHVSHLHTEVRPRNGTEHYGGQGETNYQATQSGVLHSVTPAVAAS